MSDEENYFECPRLHATLPCTACTRNKQKQGRTSFTFSSLLPCEQCSGWEQYKDTLILKSSYLLKVQEELSEEHNLIFNPLGDRKFYRRYSSK